MTMKPLFIALLVLIASPATFAQTSKAAKSVTLTQTQNELISATESYKSSAEAVIKFQEEEIATAAKKLEDLRQLVAEGLVARNELTAAEDQLAASRAKLASTRKQITDSDNLIAQVKDAEAAAKLAQGQVARAALASRSLLKPTSMRYNGMAGWALSNISSVQSFFAATFGRPLPISTLGQSATHNAMRWDHHNSADVGIHPDSAEGQALITFLKSKGIPFLAFRGAIPGVSTGPHIHIGYPSSRLS
jgi:hypothetical protein